LLRSLKKGAHRPIQGHPIAWDVLQTLDYRSGARRNFVRIDLQDPIRALAKIIDGALPLIRIVFQRRSLFRVVIAS
jgi:hypothetical protein